MDSGPIGDDDLWYKRELVGARRQLGGALSQLGGAQTQLDSAQSLLPFDFGNLKKMD